MKSKTTIEVNGKQYDATTGAVIGVASTAAVRSGHNIDGFFRARHHAPKPAEHETVHVTVATPAAAPAPKPQHQPQRSLNHAKRHVPASSHRSEAAEKPVPTQHEHAAHHRVSGTSNHTRHRATQSSKTLMRNSVSRPQPSFYKQAGTVASLQHDVPHLIVPKSSVVGIDTARLVRAKEVPRSIKISHHGNPHLVTPTVAPLAVQTAPGSKPGEDEPKAVPAPKPANEPVGKPKDPNDMFEKALMGASHFVDLQAHKLHFKKQARRHVISMASGTLALIVIAGFALYQNTPGLQFKVASVQAGVSTRMPNFQAAGFAYEGAKARDGKLTVGFSKGENTYQLTQTTTNLTSDEMIDAVGGTTASGHPAYKTLEAGGTTIYRFDNTNATWVADGTWYTVSGNAALSDSQVQSLVKNV